MRWTAHLGCRLTSESFDASLGQIACWVAAALVLTLGFRKLGTLPLTETELFFGVLLVLTVGLLGVIGGLLLRIDENMRRQRRD